MKADIFCVQNLFTNIPVHATMESCLWLWFATPTGTVIGRSKALVENLLKLSVLKYIFDGQFWKQWLGLDIPFGPTFANICMFITSQFGQVINPNILNLFVYWWSVDKHPNIKFLLEVESVDNVFFGLFSKQWQQFFMLFLSFCTSRFNIREDVFCPVLFWFVLTI